MADRAHPAAPTGALIAGQASGAPATVATTRRRNLTPWLLTVPGLLVFLTVFILPMAMLLVQSFYSYSYAKGISSEPTVEHYARFFTDGYYLGVLLTTVKLGFITAGLTLVLGYPFAYLLNIARGGVKGILVFFLLAPLLISAVVRSFGWIALLGTDGLVNQAIRFLGLSDSPVKIMYTETAAIVGLVHVLLVFMVIPISESMRTIDNSLVLAARTLGASPFQVLWRVTVPLSTPGILAGTLIVFSLSSSTFVTPMLLGGPKVQVMAYLAYQQNLLLLNWPFGAALAFIMLATSATLIVLYTRLMEGRKVEVTLQ